jgi:hypothetical protein
MDGINTAMWAHLPGAYDVWRSIYPPLSFVWLKIFSLSQCYADADGFSIRDCDWVFRYTMWGFFFLNLPLIYLMYRRTDGRTAVPRAIAVGLGLPMLFALERGNLVIPCFTFFALGHGPFLRSARLKWLCVAMTVNFKPYLIGPVFASLLRRRWRWFEGCVVSIILVYAVSYVLYGSGSPMEVIENMIIFAESGREADWSVSYYASSYVSLTGFLESDFPLMIRLGSWQIEFWSWALPWIIHFGQAMVVLAGIATLLQPGAIPRYRMAALATLFAVCSQETGGYAQVFALFLVFFERWQGPMRIIALSGAYLLCMTADYVIAPFMGHVVQESYAGNRPVDAAYGVGIGSIARPGILLLIMISLSIATIGDALKAYRARGGHLMPSRLKPEPT